MSKKKRFGLSEALTRGLSETINVVENNLGVFRNAILPLSRIKLDPDNPRKLLIDLSDVKEGIRPDDAVYQQKQLELEKLKELSYTIKTSGIINPIIVYKRGGEFYRVVAGERRCLASILAGKQEIEARVFNEKPKEFDLRVIQWIENTARDDLTLDERLDNVRVIIREYQHRYEGVDVTATLLKNITGLSLSQTSYYLIVLNAPEDVKLHIKKGDIRALDKAAFIANITIVDLRKQAIEFCTNGATLKQLKNLVTQHKILNKPKSTLHIHQRGRATTKVNMGSTPNTKVIKTIIDSVMSQKPFNQYLNIFSTVNWTDLKEATKAFRKLINLLEDEGAI